MAQIGKRHTTLGRRACRWALILLTLWAAWAAGIWYAWHHPSLVGAAVLFAALVFAALLGVLLHLTNVSLICIRGYLAERGVFGALRRLPDEYWLLNDIVIASGEKRSQIDHVLVSPRGCWCVEAKSHLGMVFGKERDHNWTQVKHSESGKRYKSRLYNPIRQNATHCKVLAAHLENELGLRPPVKSVVVFTSAKLQVESETPVVGLRDVVPTILAHDQVMVLSEQDVAKIVELLGGPKAEEEEPAA